MNILLTNDDGYQAQGILLLKEKLLIKHNVFLCAPMKEMSASSHAITLFKPMETIKLDVQSYAVNGTPADCVKVALAHFFKDIKIDIIISGINDAPNMGDDILYSGTVAGAREGALNNIFSIAASLDAWTEVKDFTYPVQFISELLDHLDKRILKENIMLNINFPNLPKAKGIKITHLGNRVYKDYIIVEEKEDKVYVTITGDPPGFGHNDGSDLNSVHDGYVSITPLANEVNDPKMREKLRYLESLPWKSLISE